MAMFLMAGIYTYISKKIYSFGHFVQFASFIWLEAFVILPVVAIAFLVDRKYPHILLLFDRLSYFSCIGYFLFKDFLWIYHKNPYQSGATEIYGKGSLLHFICHTDKIQGYLMASLFLLGLIGWGLQIIKKKGELYLGENHLGFIL